MQIDLPQDLVARVQERTAAQGTTDAEVIRKSLDSLDWLDQERIAIQEGLDAWQSGDVENFDDFDRKFRAKNGISADA